MYTDNDERENRSFPLRDFLLKLLLVIIFVILLVWLLPKFITMPSLPQNNDLSVLTSQIFSDNLERMKLAATNYYTDERLPQEVGEVKKITLRGMISEKLLVPLIDKHGKSCDVDNSYVSVTKLDDEYLMKVYLECSQEKDYILVHMGCYTYCESGLCDKQDVVIAQPKPTPTPKPVPDNPNPPTPVDPEPDKPNPPEENKEKEYEYARDVNTSSYKWSAWTNWVLYKGTENIKGLTCAENDANCLREVEVKKEYKKVGTVKKKTVVERETYVEDPTASYTVEYCKEFSYQVYNNKTYAYGAGSWVKQGEPVGFTNGEVPQESTGVTWERLNAVAICDDKNGCSAYPMIYYQKYVYTGTITDATNNYDVTLKCSEKATKKVTVYLKTRVYDTVWYEAPHYEEVQYYRERTRKFSADSKKEYVWSYYDNKELLNNKWYYTGKERDKQ